MTRLETKHKWMTRWTHWVNFPVLFVMIWSGLLIYWANDVYRIGAGRFTLFHFFPDWFYQTFQIDHRLAEGMALHFFFMWLFALNGIVYVAYTIFSGEWRHLAPDRDSLRQAIQVFLHDLGLRKEAPPQGRFNGAQKFAYTGVVLMGAGSLVTGLAIYRPVQLSWLTALLGGYGFARILHFALTMSYVAFFAVHVAQAMRAGWHNFRAMLTGLEVVRTDEGAAE